MVPGSVSVRDDEATWIVGLEELAELLPLAQRYPSHRQRVLDPAHVVLMEAGVVLDAAMRQDGRDWVAQYLLKVED